MSHHAKGGARAERTRAWLTHVALIGRDWKSRSPQAGAPCDRRAIGPLGDSVAPRPLIELARSRGSPSVRATVGSHEAAFAGLSAASGGAPARYGGRRSDGFAGLSVLSGGGGIRTLDTPLRRVPVFEIFAMVIQTIVTPEGACPHRDGASILHCTSAFTRKRERHCVRERSWTGGGSTPRQDHCGKGRCPARTSPRKTGVLGTVPIRRRGGSFEPAAAHHPVAGKDSP